MEEGRALIHQQAENERNILGRISLREDQKARKNGCTVTTYSCDISTKADQADLARNSEMLQNH